MPQLEKNLQSNEDPAQPRINKQNLKKKKAVWSKKKKRRRRRSPWRIKKILKKPKENEKPT